MGFAESGDTTLREVWGAEVHSKFWQEAKLFSTMLQHTQAY
jgi:hypothetical protein